MPSLNDSILVYCSNLLPPVAPVVAEDYLLSSDDAGTVSISRWNAARLGPQPSAATLAAVTQAQVDGYYQGLRRTDGNAAILAANNVALRAVCYALLDQLNVIRSKLVPALGAITTAQALAAIKAKIDAGGAD